MRNKKARVPHVQEFYSSSGSREKVLYHGRYNDFGEIDLIPYDKIDIKEEINSHLYECDMSIILSKLSAGDVSVVNRNVPMYLDLSSFPKTNQELLQFMKDSKESFYALDSDKRKEFDNDFGKFVAEIGTEHWKNVIFGEEKNNE